MDAFVMNGFLMLRLLDAMNPLVYDWNEENTF